MARKMKEWTEKRIYWDIFLYLGMYYKGKIRFSKKFDKHIKAHIKILENKDK